VSAHVLTLGCARNEVDSEELAARLVADGYQMVTDPADAEVVLVNTCGFIEAAKKDSIDALLEVADLKGDGRRTQRVIAVGCMAQRYGAELAAELPELDAVLGFDDYAGIGAQVRRVLAGERVAAPVTGDRRLRQAARPQGASPADLIAPETMPVTLGGPNRWRLRLDDAPYAPLRIATGCDRRCAFCAIPSFRGLYLSRDPAEVVAEAQWLASSGVREVMLVSENSSSYGKDRHESQALERLLARLGQVDGLEWLRVSYLQPAEVRPQLIEAMCTLPKVVPYFDLSFQHASASVLRRMRRFGDGESFLGLVEQIRSYRPEAGLRTNFIVGFPGETDDDLTALHGFMAEAAFDAVGVFGFSAEDGTEAAGLDGQLSASEIDDRLRVTSELAEWLTNARAEQRVGERVRLLLESTTGVGRAAHQGPEVDGATTLTGDGPFAVGDMVWAEVIGCDGIDLVARAVG
jgi:ribosomal protein S12 methylthiotransferase RimO